MSAEESHERKHEKSHEHEKPRRRSPRGITSPRPTPAGGRAREGTRAGAGAIATPLRYTTSGHRERGREAPILQGRQREGGSGKGGCAPLCRTPNVAAPPPRREFKRHLPLGH